MKKFIHYSFYFGITLTFLAITSSWLQMCFSSTKVAKQRGAKNTHSSLFPSLPMKQGPSVSMISIDGVLNEGENYFHGGITPIIEALEDGLNDEDIKGFILVINSPGGAVDASKRVYDKIMEVRKKKPVVAMVTAIAASGAYYIASACDKIVASEASLIGSIGVISMHLELYKFLERIGIKAEVIKAGKFKDASYPFRSLTPQERALEQEMIDEYYNLFLKDVAEGRKKKLNLVQTWAEGRIFTGKKAYALKMVDSLGRETEAIKEMKALLKTSIDPVIIEPERNIDYYLSKYLSVYLAPKNTRTQPLTTNPIMYIYPQMELSKIFFSMLGVGVGLKNE